MIELTAVLELRKALEEKFGKDIVVIDIRTVSSIADYFVIATGSSAPQMQALATAAEESLTKSGFTLGHVEGLQDGKWVLLDYGTIIVHLFDKDNRQFYDLERIWRDGKMIE